MSVKNRIFFFFFAVLERCSEMYAAICVYEGGDLCNLAGGYSRTVSEVSGGAQWARRCVVSNPLGCANKIARSTTSKKWKPVGF